MKHLEETDGFSEEQNGFRKSRSCLHHIYALTALARNKIQDNKGGIYTAFMDFRKAFDLTNRKQMQLSLTQKGICGPILEVFNQMYTNMMNMIRINGELSPEFCSELGLKQGDNLSPTCFGQFIDDLIVHLNKTHVGIDIGNQKVCCLAYADDIVIMAENESDMQLLLNQLHLWCKKWHMVINTDKTKTMHIRKRNTKCSNKTFQLGSVNLEMVKMYKYLGVTISEFLDEGWIVDELAKSGSRVLGEVINKTRTNYDLGYNAYTKLFHCCVTPILDYASGAWCIGSNVNCRSLDKIQYRAIRHFCGVPKTTSLLGLTSEMGWLPGSVRCDVEAL